MRKPIVTPDSPRLETVCYDQLFAAKSSTVISAMLKAKDATTARSNSTSRFTPPSSNQERHPHAPLRVDFAISPRPLQDESDRDADSNLTGHLKLLEDVCTTRNKSVGMRVEIQNKRQDHAHQLGHVLQALETFVGSMQSCTCAHLAPTLQGGLAELREVQKHLTEINVELQHEEARLGALDDDLTLMEKELYDQLAVPQGLGTLDLVSDGYVEDLKGDSNFSSRTASSSSVVEPAIVRDYYDQLGDVNLIRERLFNFESEHSRQLNLREARKAAQKPVPQPDAMFFQEYFINRKILVREYSKGKEKVERLRQECQRQKHHVEEPNIAPFAERDALDRSIREYRLENQVPFQSMRNNFRINQVSLSHDSTLQILQWLVNIPKPDLPLSAAVIEYTAQPDGSDSEPSRAVLHELETEPDPDDRFYSPPDETIVSHWAPTTTSRNSNERRFQPEKPKRRYSNASMYTRLDLQRQRNSQFYAPPSSTT